MARLEVLVVQVFRHRQGHDELDTEILGGERDDAVRALGQRRHDLQRTVRKPRGQVREEVAHGSLDARHFVRHQVAVPGDADDKRQRRPRFRGRRYRTVILSRHHARQDTASLRPPRRPV